MEKNSWNDIGLKFGLANAGNEIEVECETIDGWLTPQENLGSFTLNEDGYRVSAQYEQLNGVTSVGYNKRNYNIHFINQDQADLFEPYSGLLAFEKGNSVSSFTVHYPNSFYDEEGNRWEADKKSPQVFTMSAMDENQKYVTYHQVYENKKEQFIVESNADVNRILNEFATHTYNSERHDFYLIGRDYSPAGTEVSDTMFTNNLAGFTNEVVDRFDLNGTTYIVSLIGYYKKWNQGTCSHEWAYKEEVKVGTGITPESLKMRVLLGKRYNPAKGIFGGKTYTFGQKANDLAKLILRSEHKGFCKICNQLVTNCLFSIY